MTNISVVILNFNGEKLLPQFLPSVIAHTPDADIVVADNGSTDNSTEILKRNFPSVQLIQLEKNFGFCGGYNRALTQIQSRYYVLLNSDVEVTPGWLAPLIELMNNDPAIAAVQPKIRSHRQRDHFEYAGAAGGFIDSLGYPFCRGRIFNHLEKDTGQYDDVREVFWTSGACMAIRASDFHKIGGLDDSFFAHMEEIDLCWKLQRAGKKVFYSSHSTVYHLGAGTLSALSPQKTYFNFRNGLNLIFRHFSAATLLYKLPVRILLDHIAAIKFLLEGNASHAWAVCRAHVHFLGGLPRALRTRHKLNQYPFSSDNMYSGSLPIQYFVLGRKKVEV